MFCVSSAISTTELLSQEILSLHICGYLSQSVTINQFNCLRCVVFVFYEVPIVVFPFNFIDGDMLLSYFIGILSFPLVVLLVVVHLCNICVHNIGKHFCICIVCKNVVVNLYLILISRSFHFYLGYL